MSVILPHLAGLVSEMSQFEKTGGQIGADPKAANCNLESAFMQQNEKMEKAFAQHRQKMKSLGYELQQAKVYPVVLNVDLVYAIFN